MADKAPRRGPGRPPGEEPPKKPVSCHIRPESIAWMNDNLPRGVSRSAFIDEAVAEKIKRRQKRA